jgi:hypothetical protein
MRNFWKYLLVGLLVLGLVLMVALPFFSRGLGFNRGFGMMGNWGFFPMTQAPAPWAGVGGFGILGGLMMLLFMVLPIGLIVLAVAGVFSLLRRPDTTVIPSDTPAATRTCHACGKSADTQWTTCPYCSKKL